MKSNENNVSKPKYHKGKYVKDWWTCGHCGDQIYEIVYNYCPWCGYKIKWDSIRCLTK